jgi:hypothetical protein
MRKPERTEPLPYRCGASLEVPALRATLGEAPAPGPTAELSGVLLVEGGFML